MSDDRYPDQDDDELVVEEIVIEDIDVQPEPPAGEPLLQTEGQELLLEEEGGPDYARGQELLPESEVRPDFARGQEEDDPRVRQGRLRPRPAGG